MKGRPLSSTDGRETSTSTLPAWMVVLLGLIGVPGLVVRDLSEPSGQLLDSVLVLAPPVLWALVAVMKRLTAPLPTVAAMGLVHGVAAAVVHNVAWDGFLRADTPVLGGNLADIDPAMSETVLRAGVATSSVFTGVMMGLVSGAVAALVVHLTRRSS